ncbi:hypothetical protein RKD55_003688 [Rossellomorea marisflavi]|jgi:hypothetical protein|uniref:hypothetical protein n=1 Tax=Rossellomorea sp. RS05 TaxID=3149166 RepID=UPI00114DAFEE
MFFILWGVILVLTLTALSIIPFKRAFWLVPPIGYALIITVFLLSPGTDPAYHVWQFKLQLAQLIGVPFITTTAGILLYKQFRST